MKPNKKDVTISYKGKKIVVEQSHVHIETTVRIDHSVYLDNNAYYLARESRCIN